MQKGASAWIGHLSLLDYCSRFLTRYLLLLSTDPNQSLLNTGARAGPATLAANLGGSSFQSNRQPIVVCLTRLNKPFPLTSSSFAYSAPTSSYCSFKTTRPALSGGLALSYSSSAQLGISKPAHWSILSVSGIISITYTYYTLTVFNFILRKYLFAFK